MKGHLELLVSEGKITEEEAGVRLENIGENKMKNKFIGKEGTPTFNEGEIKESR